MSSTKFSKNTYKQCDLDSFKLFTMASLRQEKGIEFQGADVLHMKAFIYFRYSTFDLKQIKLH